MGSRDAETQTVVYRLTGATASEVRIQQSVGGQRRPWVVTRWQKQATQTLKIDTETTCPPGQLWGRARETELKS